MITNDFNDFLKNANYIQSYFKNNFIIPKITKSTDDKMVDRIWDAMESNCKIFSIDLSDEIKALKYDVIMSVYTTIKYGLCPHSTQGDIFSAAKETDSVYKNQASASSEETNLSHIRSNLNKAFTAFPISRQNTYDALNYLSPYWTNKAPLISFNNLDFYHIIKAYSHWPFYPDNSDGMTFYDYFQGIKEIFNNLSPITGQLTETEQNQLKFDNNFSAYVIEELFRPQSFILNVSEFLSKYGSIFTDINNPRREQAIILLNPLSNLPLSLWDKVKNPYFQAIGEYTDNPKNILNRIQIDAKLSQLIFYQNFLYPFLQSVFSMAVYNSLGSKRDKIHDILQSYILKHSEFFGYFTSLEKQLEHLSEIYYPNADSGKKRCGLAEDSKNKRNDYTKSFEINFTYNFFNAPQTVNFFSYWRNTRNTQLTIENYIFENIPYYRSQCDNIFNSLTTQNYLRKTSSKQIDNGSTFYLK